MEPSQQRAEDALRIRASAKRERGKRLKWVRSMPSLVPSEPPLYASNLFYAPMVSLRQIEVMLSCYPDHQPFCHLLSIAKRLEAGLTETPPPDVTIVEDGVRITSSMYSSTMYSTE